jgi:glutamate synthase (NADPH/NADH) small chain
MEFLTQSNRRVAGDTVPEPEAILATGKRVIVLGGGDTGSDCVGTSLRQNAIDVTSFELLPRPPEHRIATNPWPAWPQILRSSSSHEEGGTRDWGVMTTELLGNESGCVRALRATRVQLSQGKIEAVAGTELEVPCDLVLLAMGFLGSEQPGLLDQLGVTMDARGNVKTDRTGATSVRGVFAAGDMARGQSLVVWAIAEGRKVADSIHAFLTAPAHRRLAAFA